MKSGYGTIYRFEYDATCSPFNALLTTKCKVLILKRDYSGAIIDIPYGQASPVEIDYPTSNDDIFYPLKGSSLAFRVLGGIINMDSIVSEDEQEYFIEYYRDNVIFWTGFVTPELCEEDIFLRYPAIEFKAIDGLGTLKGKEFTIDNKYPDGIVSLVKLIQNSLKLLGFDYNLNVLLKMWYSTHSKTSYSTPLEQTYVFNPALKDINFKYVSNVDLLLNISNIFNGFIYQNYGEWYFVKPKDLAFGVNDASIFNTSGVLNTSSKKNIPVFRHGEHFLIIAEPKRKLRRYYKQVEIDYNYSVNKLLNGDFSMWDETPTQYTYTDSLTFITGTPTETNFYSVDKFQSLGNAKTYLVYESLANQYIFAITATSSNDGMYLRSVEFSDPQGFSLNVDCKTGNPKFALLATQVTYSGGSPWITSYKFYDFSSNSWINWTTGNAIPKYNKADFYPTEDKFSYNLNVDRPDFYVDPNQEAYYSIGIILYPEVRTGFSGNESFYSRININGQAPNVFLNNNYPTGKYGKLSKEIIKIDNNKKASIVPNVVQVFNGDAYYSNGFKFEDNSNFKVLVGGVYQSTSFPHDVSGTLVDGWKERDEDGLYSSLELCARNILNQYSDYRNIFTGTIIGKNLQFGAIYEFPNQGVLSSRKFFPLSIKLNEKDCTAEVVLMELSSNEITGQMNISRYDSNGNLILSATTESKKKIVMG